MKRFLLETMIFRAPAAGGTPGGEAAASAAAPSPAPAPAPVDSNAGASSDASSDGIDWGSLDSTDDLDEVILPAPDAGSLEGDAAEAGSQVNAPPEGSAPPAAPDPASQPPAAAAPEQPPAPGPSEAPQTPASPSAEPVDPWATFNENKPTIMERLAKQDYALSKEDMELLESAPQEALPMLAAKVHVNMVEATVRMMTEMLPLAFSQMAAAQQKQAGAVDAFKARWPQVDVAKHGAELDQLARLYRGMNPSATAEQAIEDVGLMLVTKLGLAAAPAAPSAPAPQAPAAPQGFRPAVPGNSIAPASTPQIEEFGGLGMDFSD